jgi:hypothetical protein
MPKQYEKIRDYEVKKGVPYDEAQSIAAATYNKQHPDHPVTGKHNKGHKSGRKK